MFPMFMMRGEIQIRGCIKQEQNIQRSKQEDSEGSEESKGGLDRLVGWLFLGLTAF